MRAREEGAALIEFALVLPIFLMLVLAMFTGGNAYSTKLSVTQAAREAARAGATIPVTAAGMDAWLTGIAEIARRSADGELAAGQAGQRICVAYVSGASTRQRSEVGGIVTYGSTPCISDGLSNRRVQVVTSRTERLEALLFSQTLVLDARGVSRHESTGP